MSHTPAPWFTEATSKIGHFAVCDAEGFTVCNPSPMGTANARLIAAAPELLDACARALGLLTDPDASEHDADTVTDILRAAINKAKEATT